MFVGRVLGGVAIILPFWYVFVNLVFAFSLGQDPNFDLGDNYIVTHRLLYYRSKAEAGYYIEERVIDDPIVEFAFSGPWLVGKTNNGLFAIQRKTQELHYPLAKDQLQTVTGLDTSSLDMETDFGPYVIARPEALAAKDAATRFCWVLLFIVPAAFGFAPYLWRYMLTRRKK